MLATMWTMVLSTTQTGRAANHFAFLTTHQPLILSMLPFQWTIAMNMTRRGLELSCCFFSQNHLTEWFRGGSASDIDYSDPLIVFTPQECQLWCQNHTDCEFWSLYSGMCVLWDSPGDKYQTQDIISGPKFCPSMCWCKSSDAGGAARNGSISGDATCGTQGEELLLLYIDGIV